MILSKSRSKDRFQSLFNECCRAYVCVYVVTHWLACLVLGIHRTLKLHSRLQMRPPSTLPFTASNYSKTFHYMHTKMTNNTMHINYAECMPSVSLYTYLDTTTAKAFTKVTFPCWCSKQNINSQKGSRLNIYLSCPTC